MLSKFLLSANVLSYVISLSSLINHLIIDRLLDAWPTVIQTSPQLISILHRNLIDLLLYCCWDSLIYLPKS